MRELVFVAQLQCLVLKQTQTLFQITLDTQLKIALRSKIIHALYLHVSSDAAGELTGAVGLTPMHSFSPIRGNLSHDTTSGHLKPNSFKDLSQLTLALSQRERHGGTAVLDKVQIGA